MFYVKVTLTNTVYSLIDTDGQSVNVGYLSTEGLHNGPVPLNRRDLVKVLRKFARLEEYCEFSVTTGNSADNYFQFMDKLRVARLAYYVCTHPMQYGNGAKKADWLQAIADIFNSIFDHNLTTEQCQAVADSYPACRLHSV